MDVQWVAMDNQIKKILVWPEKDLGRWIHANNKSKKEGKDLWIWKDEEKIYTAKSPYKKL